MSQPLFLVDAFADRPFVGNPASVCVLDGPPQDSWMQSVAAEMNQAETAFCWQEDDGWRLRWFTPLAEVDLCGHATLATAHVLWECAYASDGQVHFATRSGQLRCRRERELISMDFPGLGWRPVENADALASALEGQPLDEVASKFDALAVFDSEAQVCALQPNLDAVARLPYRGVIVAARCDRPGVDFVSRFFAPRVGVPEDPVTGSAHCLLAPYFARILGRNDLVGEQMSRRGGSVICRVHGERVILAGRAVTVLTGELRAPP